MRENGRWHLTDLQRVLVVLTVALALFLFAMAWGSSSVPLLLVASALVVGAGLAIFLLGLRYNARRPVPGTGYVISVPRPPVDNIQGRCDMRMRVNLPGRPPAEMRVRDPAVPVTRWPVVGQTLPIEASAGNLRQVRVRWDLVELGYVRAPDATPPRQPVDVEPTVIHSPTPPTVHVYTDYAPGAFDDGPAGDDRMDGPDIDASDSGPAAVRGIPIPRPAQEPTNSTTGNGLPTRDTGEELPVRTTGETTPTPRASAEASVRARNGEAPALDEPAGMGGMLIVSDLDRSLRFYTEVLGFSVVHSAPGNAVIEYGGGQVLLQHMPDFSPVDRRVGHLHIQVPDLERAYADLVAKGVQFSHRPKMVSRGEDMELWKAAFRDPDGHGVALTQWRRR